MTGVSSACCIAASTFVRNLFCAVNAVPEPRIGVRSLSYVSSIAQKVSANGVVKAFDAVVCESLCLVQHEVDQAAVSVDRLLHVTLRANSEAVHVRARPVGQPLRPPGCSPVGCGSTPNSLLIVW